MSLHNDRAISTFKSSEGAPFIHYFRLCRCVNTRACLHGCDMCNLGVHQTVKRTASYDIPFSLITIFQTPGFFAHSLLVGMPDNLDSTTIKPKTTGNCNNAHKYHLFIVQNFFPLCHKSIVKNAGEATNILLVFRGQSKFHN